MTPRIMDRSMETIRARSEESVLWIEGEPITGRISDQLWAWRQDVVTLLAEMDAAARREAALREALEGMAYQFGYWSDGVGGIGTGGLSALEDAFAVLGWDDPRPVPEMRCDEPGCLRQSSAGWPTRPGGTGLNGGYRRTRLHFTEVPEHDPDGCGLCRFGDGLITEARDEAARDALMVLRADVVALNLPHAATLALIDGYLDRLNDALEPMP